MEKNEFHQYIKKEIESLNLICENPLIKKELANELHNTVQEIHDYLVCIDKDLTEDLLPDTYYVKVRHNIEELRVFDINQRLNTIDLSTIDSHRFKQYFPYLAKTTLLFRTYSFYRNLNFFTQNTVVVGANGSGKSSLTSMLKESLDGRDGIVIPAQKLLIVPTFDSMPSFISSHKEYDSYQKQDKNGKTTYDASLTTDIPYSEIQKYGSEYKYVLKLLIAERIDIRNRVCNDIEDDKNRDKTHLHSKLNKALEIWNSLIEHRTIFCDTDNNIKLKTKTAEEKVYPAHQMSDGEKLMFFLIGRILLSPSKALIVIDEPEMYLHKAIVNKLWDRLETERPDCLFVYLTHDLEFASSRCANKYWIKSFEYPFTWEIEPIPDNEIPPGLLMRLLGSRKKILFCEGEVNKSHDIQIFECLFRQYTIIPVQSCADVIHYTRAYNKLPDKNSIAYGIIDRDFRVQEQLDKFETENIYSFAVVEIENLFLVEDFILKYANFKNENIDIEQIKSKVLGLLSMNKAQQTSNYVSAYINYNFTESHVKKGNTQEEVNTNYDLFKKNIKIEEWYTEREKTIEDIISSKNYTQAIMIYNNKGLHSAVEDVLGLKSNTYRDKALGFLQHNKEAQDVLRNVFPKGLTTNK